MGMSQNHCNEMTLLDKLFLVLVKLRLAVPNEDLAYRMGISKASVRFVCQPLRSSDNKQLDDKSE